jgi:hypothetical protein
MALAKYVVYNSKYIYHYSNNNYWDNGFHFPPLINFSMQFTQKLSSTPLEFNLSTYFGLSQKSHFMILFYHRFLF